MKNHTVRTTRAVSITLSAGLAALMGLAFAVLLLVGLSGCATTETAPSAAPTKPSITRLAREARETAACRRSAYCASYNPSGKTDAQIDAELHDVRAAVDANIR